MWTAQRGPVHLWSLSVLRGQLVLGQAVGILKLSDSGGNSWARCWACLMRYSTFYLQVPQRHTGIHFSKVSRLMLFDFEYQMEYQMYPHFRNTKQKTKNPLPIQRKETTVLKNRHRCKEEILVTITIKTLDSQNT